MNTDEHKSEFESIEAELDMLRPRALSSGFVESLGKRLESPVQVEQGGWTRKSWFVALSAIAAVVLIAVGLRFGRQTGDIEANPVAMVEAQNAVIDQLLEQNERLPTLVAYNQALLQGDGKLDELLNFHANTLLPDYPFPAEFSQ